MELVKKFKKVDGSFVEDVVKHTLSILENDPYVDIHIGTDSQNISDDTVYVTSIAYRFGTRGVHYIYAKYKLPRINDLWTRLWKEAEYSVEVAQWFTSKINIKVQIDLDYNDDKFYKSNQLVQAATGWVKSLGYVANTKPGIQIATKSSDYQCR